MGCWSSAAAESPTPHSSPPGVDINKLRAFAALSRDSQGFSLAEIVIAMFVLATLSLALIPALIFGVQQSKNNAVIAAATDLLASRLEEARGQSASCQAVASFASSSVADVVESHGISLHLNQVMDACPAAYPGTVRYTVSVVRADTGETLSSASTLIFVQAAS